MDDFNDIPYHATSSLPVKISDDRREVYLRYLSPLIEDLKSGKTIFTIKMYGPTVAQSILHDNMRGAAIDNFKFLLVQKGYVYEEVFMKRDVNDVLEGRCREGVKTIRIIN